MDNKDTEIERKLKQLELSVIKDEKKAETEHALASTAPGTSVTPGSTDSATPSVNSDLCYFGGLALILTGLLMFFNHVHVGTGFLAFLGMNGGGFALLLIPLMIGIGWMFYDSKNKIAWLLTAASCGVIVFAVLSSLIMNFPSISLLGLLMMLLPFAGGGALLLKGAGGPQGVKEKFKGSNLVK
jgi:hypothetical protein